MEKVICIIGPTASGKTSLGISLAKQLNGEIISADSMQIYRGLDIGSAKVTKAEMDGIQHHLIDICDINETFSVADYKKLCYNKIEEILNKGKVPIIVGGTGLYISSVVLDYNFSDEKVDLEYRNYLYDLAEKFGNEYVYSMLVELDNDSAKDIHCNNLKRVIRALEICRIDKTKSKHMELEEKRKKSFVSKYDFKVFYLNLDKNILDDRINKRVDQMINLGLEKEARTLYDSEKCTASQAIGYKEFYNYFANKTSLSEVTQEIKLKTRQYAKRQVTWFKKIPSVINLNGLETKDKLIEEIKREVYEK